MEMLDWGVYGDLLLGMPITWKTYYLVSKIKFICLVK
jgi:hypothetical protein